MSVDGDDITLEQAATGISLPNWYRGFDEAAVRAGVRDTQHRADPTADEPKPACGAPIPECFDWKPEERDADGRDQCHHQKCWGTHDQTQEKTPAKHVQDAARDDRQLDLSSGRWSQ